MTGVLCATLEEARPLLERHGGEQIAAEPFAVHRLGGRHAEARVSHPPASGGDGAPPSILIIISGMGMEAARRACRELVGKYAVGDVINAGVCGALGPGLGRGSVFAISAVVAADSAPPSTTLTLDPVPGIEARTLVTVQAPVFDPERRAALAKAGDLVDMEGFAVAEECRILGVPCCLIKGVTDFGDHDGKEDIRTHLGPVSENVAEVVLRILSSVRSLSDARSLQWELKDRAGCARPAAAAQPPLYWGIQKQDCSGTMGDASGAPLRVAREDTRHIDLGAERVNVPAGIVTDSAPKAVTPSDAVHGPPVNPASGGPAAGALLPKLLRFTRVEHTLFSLPLLFAGAWLGADGHCPPLRTLALIALVGTGARTFGMAVNRIVDRDLDAENPRTAQRELPAGRLSLWQAYVVAAAGMAAYLLGCAWLGPTVLKLSLVPIVPLALYSFLKRFTSLCHYGIGLCLALAPLGAYVAVTGGLAFSPQVIGLAVFTFGWMSGFDIIYALLDVEFDRAHGVRSLPAAVGPVRAQWIAAMTHLISAAALIRLWYDGAGMMSGLALLVALGALGAAYWQRLPVSFRFFPVSVIAGMAGALVVLLERFP